MQSGRGNTKRWLLEFEPASARSVDPVMGWVSSTDTGTQVCLKFDEREQAVAYAEKYGIGYRIFEPHDRQPRIKAYADNFK